MTGVQGEHNAVIDVFIESLKNEQGWPVHYKMVNMFYLAKVFMFKNGVLPLNDLFCR